MGSPSFGGLRTKRPLRTRHAQSAAPVVRVLPFALRVAWVVVGEPEGAAGVVSVRWSRNQLHTYRTLRRAFKKYAPRKARVWLCTNSDRYFTAYLFHAETGAYASVRRNYDGCGPNSGMG